MRFWRPTSPTTKRQFASGRKPQDAGVYSPPAASGTRAAIGRCTTSGAGEPASGIRSRSTGHCGGPSIAWCPRNPPPRGLPSQRRPLACTDGVQYLVAAAQLSVARNPRICVTLFTSHPSESMFTLTMQRTCSPGLFVEPTVLTISRSTDSRPLSVNRRGILTPWEG